MCERERERERGQVENYIQKQVLSKNVEKTDRQASLILMAGKCLGGLKRRLHRKTTIDSTLNALTGKSKKVYQTAIFFTSCQQTRQKREGR